MEARAKNAELTFEAITSLWRFVLRCIRTVMAIKVQLPMVAVLAMAYLLLNINLLHKIYIVVIRYLIGQVGYNQAFDAIAKFFG